MGENKLYDKPHVLYAAVIFIIGLSFVISWSYFRNEEIIIKKQEQERITAEKYEKQVEAESNASMRDGCLRDADILYWEFVRLNGKRGKDGSYTMPQHQWDHINKQTKEVKELCFKKYPLK